MTKVSEFITKEFDTIIKDSREFRAYELGTASGYFYLYDYIKNDDGVEKANKSFKSILEGTDRTSEYFRKMIELSNEPLTELEKKIFDFKEKNEKYEASQQK